MITNIAVMALLAALHVNAGADIRATFNHQLTQDNPGIVQLHGQADTPERTVWQTVSPRPEPNGPPDVIIEQPDRLDTAIRVTRPGTYTLQLLGPNDADMIQITVIEQRGNVLTRTIQKILGRTPAPPPPPPPPAPPDRAVASGQPDFHLAVGSPAIGAGLCIPGITTDFDGKPRPTPGRAAGKGCDIGAFQYVGGPPPPPGPPSPDGTRVPPASQITDASGGVWTFNGRAILLNGLSADGGAGSILTWCGGQIRAFGSPSWWLWSGTTWTDIGPTDPCVAQPVDVANPTVTMTAQAPVNGNITLTATATDVTPAVGDTESGVNSVQFYRGTTAIGTPLTAAPYTLVWNSTTVANGTYAFTARAIDKVGNTGVSPAVNITVTNVSSDVTAPVVTITAPVNNATITPTNGKPNQTVTVSASDTNAITELGVSLNGGPKAMFYNENSAQFQWRALTYKGMSVTITVTAKDASGNVGQKTATITVK